MSCEALVAVSGESGGWALPMAWLIPMPHWAAWRETGMHRQIGGYSIMMRLHEPSQLVTFISLTN